MVTNGTAPSGQHILIDGYGVNGALLNDREYIEQALIDAVKSGKVTLLKLASHAFEPHGVTAFALLTESHIAIHTWPESGFFTADLYFCGGDIEASAQALTTALKPEFTEVSRVQRGKPHHSMAASENPNPGLQPLETETGELIRK